MSNGIYAAAAGMAAQQIRMNSISTDLANADTNGYKSEEIGFQDLLYGSEDGVATGSGAAAIDVGPSMTEGTLSASDNPLSVAINGPGFLQFRRADGTIGLSRDGNLQLDSQGNLIAATGERLVPPIRVPAGTMPTDVRIATDGTVTAAGKTVGKLQIVGVGAPSGLQPVESNMFAVTAASGRTVAVKIPQLEQGQIEGSNVDVNASMSDLLDAQQNYTILSHAISTQDQLLQIANQMRN